MADDRLNHDRSEEEELEEEFERESGASAEDLWRRFAGPSGIAGLICLLGSGAVYLTANQFTGAVAALLVLALAFLLLWGFGDPESALAVFGARQTRYGSNTVVMAVAFIGVLVLVNYLAARHSPKYDTTANKSNTLSPLSVKILQNLKEPVTITAFFSQEAFGKDQFQRLMKQVEGVTNKITVKYVDPIREPTLAGQFNVRMDGTTVLQMGSKRQDITVADEQSLLTAINKLENEQQKKVLFLIGHGERSLDGSNLNDISQVKVDLQNATFIVDMLNLASASEVPKDAAVVVIAAPRQPLAENEVAALSTYLESGGKVLAMSEPYSKSNLNDVIGKYDVTFEKGLVIDVQSNLQGHAELPLVARFPNTPITAGLPNTLFPGSTGVKIKQPPGRDMNAQPLAQTSGQNSWLHQSDDLNDLRFKEGTDVRGPITLAASVEALSSATPTLTPGAAASPTAAPGEGEGAKRRTRLVVVGTAELASNQFFTRIPGNHDFFLNAVKWLAEEEQLTGIGPKSPMDRTVILSGAAQRLILWTTLGLFPFGVMAIGAVVWWRRR